MDETTAPAATEKPIATQKPTVAEKTAAAQDDVRGLQHQWIWFLLLGIAMCILGIIAIAAAPFTAVATATVFGMLMLAAGIAQTISSFWSEKWSGVALSLFIGVLYTVGGIIIVARPIEGAAALALMAASLLIVGGAVRIITSIRDQFFGWGWVLLNGIISLLLGIIIFSEFPLSIIYIGIFVGVDLLMTGIAWIFFSTSLGSLEKQPGDAI